VRKHLRSPPELWIIIAAAIGRTRSCSGLRWPPFSTRPLWPRGGNGPRGSAGAWFLVRCQQSLALTGHPPMVRSESVASETKRGAEKAFFMTHLQEELAHARARERWDWCKSRASKPVESGTNRRGEGLR
jgi:hypothetical protein